MRIFQTFVLPDELVTRHRLSFAAANFSRNLISGGSFDKVYSLIPVNIRGELGAVTESGYEVIYSRWRKKKGILAKVAIFAEQWKVFKQIHNGDSVWFYNMNMINGYLFLLLKLLKHSVKLNVIVLDFTPPAKWYQQNSFFLKLINRADGIISLSTSDLFTVKNTALLPGVVPADTMDYPIITQPKKEFLLSGVISNAIAMTPAVLRVFAAMPHATLHITGKVMEGEELILGYTRKYKNIIYHGSLSFAAYLDLLHRVTFQLSTRNPEFPENQCNFPSKIIEALLHNRIIVSTVSYPQLDGINYIKIDADNLEDGLNCVCKMEKNQLLFYANESSKVKKMFSTDVWNNTMNKLEK